MNLQIVLNTQKNLFLNQAFSKKMLANFFFQKKNPKWKISNPPKNFDHSLEIFGTLLGLECPVS